MGVTLLQDLSHRAARRELARRPSRHVEAMEPTPITTRRQNAYMAALLFAAHFFNDLIPELSILADATNDLLTVLICTRDVLDSPTGHHQDPDDTAETREE